MKDIYIKRKFIKRGEQKIKLTPEEIKQIADIYNESCKNEDTKYYKEEIIKMLENEYSKEFVKYFQTHYKSYFEQLSETCYYNQILIDSEGITSVYLLEKNCRENIKEIYNEFIKKG